MQETHYISSELLDLSTIQDIITTNKQLDLSDEALLNIKKSKEYLTSKIENNDKPIYGINTGFGLLANTKIAPHELELLQRSIVL